MKKTFIFLVAAILLNSCASAVLTSKTVKASEIKSMVNFEPISFVHLIQKGNQNKMNDSLSNVSTQLLSSVIINNTNPKVEKQITFSNPEIKSRIETDILKTMSEIIKTKKIDQIKTTPLMDSIVKNENQRFALCIITSGFDRRKGNYGNQVAKGVGIGLLTLGLYTSVPVKASTSMYAMIYDAQNSNVVFYKHIPAVEKSPTDKKNLSNLYQELFEGYFYKMQQQD
ncbi:hypothetical protein KRE40_16730 [Elizabethkingia meningoseptica]|uniref:hypothetical protein n=1 Tax=Elizabethkingia meningoseptica TaxID=238 RepID=UPI0023AEB887|nr:hypothetical protein [Elizabethkingia meningoseptica]MDE5439613.1 hypothetical protein [Elizabethkingia meningoseptica]MDE5510282.1 hypothetical protein [Elizabethkingia meningoseptica]MDE5517431.1 hypothetical protein [Elizabethkingia meningoseptica]MDE5528046.1 hypothetical protein [Elizabethkingia meningoseptica]MDE5531522.1 hypothetical protein [Elizabethkingia meningoseptica]